MSGLTSIVGVYILFFHKQLAVVLVITASLWPTTVYAQEEPKPILVFEVADKPILEAVPVVPTVQKPVDIPIPAKPSSKVHRAGQGSLQVQSPSGYIFRQGEWGGWCVEFGKKWLGASGTWGYGGDKLPLTDTPEVGAIVVFYGHVAVVIEITGDGYLVLAESNYHWNKRITIGRKVAVSSPAIRGYYKP